MPPVVNTRALTKSYGAKAALRDLSVAIGDQRVVGLIGQNGSGKTTLLDLIAGMVLPTSGACETLGCESGRLGEAELARIGVVYQENRFIEWMRVEQHLEYFGSFYEKWDRTREAALLRDLALDPKAKVGHLSGGDIQKLGIITAVCHHPRLLLLDEPLSSLDPLARASILNFILKLLDEDDVTIIVSSHALMDVERLVDWVWCLDQGELRADSALDALHERYAEWDVTALDRTLPERFAESFVLDQKNGRHQGRLVVEHTDDALQTFRQQHGVEVAVNRMNLEKIYPLLLKSRR